jgi:hypothetical protein
MKIHGMTGTVEYKAWLGMKQRCYSRSSPNYARYGGRGIEVCERWRHSFENFLHDMGPAPFPKATVERKDVDGNYEPSNCLWITKAEQQNNRSNTVRITCHGHTRTLKEWAEILGVRRNTIKERLRSGWSVEDALYTPTLSFPEAGKRASVVRWGAG